MANFESALPRDRTCRNPQSMARRPINEHAPSLLEAVHCAVEPLKLVDDALTRSMAMLVCSLFVLVVSTARAI